MFISNCFSKSGILEIHDLLSLLSKNGIEFKTMVDGGAGFGSTANEMQDFLVDSGKILAFEPNNSNISLFKSSPRITLYPFALYDKNTFVDFYIPESVTSDSHWAEKGLTGYSSLGHVINLRSKLKVWLKSLLRITSTDFTRVSAKRLDSILSTQDIIDFAKLDLQGGELRALHGFGKFLDQTKFLWVEYTGQKHLLNYLVERGFDLFDSNYMTIGIDKTDLAEAGLIVQREVIFSNNKQGYISKHDGFVSDFSEWFSHLQTKGFIQTDLIVINRRDAINPTTLLGN